jgi:photosystem II stability/assembly factor-like uncharacterized protein
MRLTAAAVLATAAALVLLLLPGCGQAQAVALPPGISSFAVPNALPARPLTAVWGVGDMGGIYATPDGGAGWRPAHSRAGSAALNAVAFSDAMSGYVGGGDQALSTADGGRHRRRQAEGVPRNWLFLGVAFSDLRHGWIAMGGYPMLWTDDGGRHWHAQALDAPGGVSALAVGKD